jgi:uncharacterized protein (DUF924 family)
VRKLLAICDDWEKLERYEERLKPWFEVTDAPFGSTGLEIARERASQFDQVVIDLGFEDMTEAEAHTRLRSEPATARLPAVFVLDASAPLPQGWNPALDRAFRRPFAFDELLASLLAESVLRFWFGKVPNVELWFGGTPEIDATIRDGFGHWVAAASEGRFDSWKGDPRRLIALIVLLDQFSLNIHRDLPASFDQSALAIPLTLQAIQNGWEKGYTLSERLFLYLPLEHAEDLPLQEKSVACFRKLVAEAPSDEKGAAEFYLDYAIKHWEVVRRFGRFPDRNPVFGREHTPDEAAYMAAGGPPF